MSKADEFRRLYGYDKIFLATDDARVLEEVPLYSQFVVRYFEDMNRAKYESPEGVYVERLGWKRLGNAFYEAIRDMYAASLCDALVGSFAASMSHVMLYLMVHRLGIVPPFKSVDEKFCRKRIDLACCLNGLVRKAYPMCRGFKANAGRACSKR